MTKEQRQQSLIKARHAVKWLRRVAPAFEETPQREVECLIAEFERLDAKEQTQIEAGRRYGKLGAEHGKRGGRPRKESK